MFHLKDKRKIKLMKIMDIKRIKIERIFKQILKNYDNIIFQELHDIKNCITIKHIIRLINKY